MKSFSAACVIALLFLLGCANQDKAGRHAAVQSIQVTETWQDLLSQPAFSQEKGTARLGIEASSAPYRSGVLVYCLTEGYSLPREWREPNRLGPFKVEIRHEDDKTEKAQAACQMAWAEPPDIAQSTALFRRSIPLYRPGKFIIRVLSLNGDLVARTVVTATRDRYHPWMTLQPASGGTPEKEDDKYDAAAYVQNRAKAIAIPSFDGMQPLLFWSDGPEKQVRTPVGDKLPTLIPANSAKVMFGLTIRAAGTDLVVESKENIVITRPDWHFLVRWWVNGKPYVPEPLDSFQDQNGMVITGKTLLLQLDFIPERVGAKAGDKVELQLLYSRNGWKLLEPMESLSGFHDMEGPELLLSNRIGLEWEANRNRRQGH